ncbi:unnamed protein product, partial [marine sediment metagenome]
HLACENCRLKERAKRKAMKQIERRGKKFIKVRKWHKSFMRGGIKVKGHYRFVEVEKF